MKKEIKNNIVEFPVPPKELLCPDDEPYKEELPEGVTRMPGMRYVFMGEAPYWWQRYIAILSLTWEQVSKDSVVAGIREINHAYEDYYNNFEDKENFVTNYYCPFYETVWDIAQKYSDEDCETLLEYAIKAFFMDMINKEMTESMMDVIERKEFPFTMKRGWVVMKHS